MLRDLRAGANRQQPTVDFTTYLAGFSPNVQDILGNFEFRNQIPRLYHADARGILIEKLTSPDINLSPDPVRHSDGSVNHPRLDNHGMGTIFEELVRRFNEEVGEYWTHHDAVRVMAKLVFQRIVDQITAGTYLLYDGVRAMLTVADDTLQELAAEHGKEVATRLYAQEINAETFAISKADLLLKGEGDAAENIMGPEHSTVSNDPNTGREFDLMFSSPPFGKNLKTDLERMGGKRNMRDLRSVVEHACDPEYSLLTLTRSTDGQMLFLANNPSKMRQRTRSAAASPKYATVVPCLPETPAGPKAKSAAGSPRATIFKGDRRPAAQHVQQHRHRHLSVGLTNSQHRGPRGKAQLIDATKLPLMVPTKPSHLRSTWRWHVSERVTALQSAIG